MIELDELPVPANAIETLARCLLPVIRSYFEGDEGKAAFAEWKSQKGTEAQPAPAEEK
jgi:hypothetical protein